MFRGAGACHRCERWLVVQVNLPACRSSPLYIALGFLSLLAPTCAPSGDDTDSGEVVAEDDGACVATDEGVQTQVLYAGQTIEAGAISVEVVGDALLVTYETTDGWELEEAHLWVGDDLADMPQTPTGNPKIGLFPYSSGDISGETTWSFEVPLEELGFSCPGDDATFHVAAHAALRKDDGSGGYQTETGWADGDRLVDRGSWATAFETTLSCDCGVEEPTGGSCETVYAYGGDLATCFIDADFDGDGEDDGISRWGWSNDISAGGDHSFEIYGGAGQCDLDKGTLVGTLEVEDHGDGSLTVTYTMDAGYGLDETHLYVGDEPLPTGANGEPTVAPGQYPMGEELEAAASASYTVEAGDFVVAHGVVCGDFE